jgi:hypothetical protein
MSEETKNSIRAFIREAIQKSGAHGTFDDHEFDVDLVDSIIAIDQLLDLSSSTKS